MRHLSPSFSAFFSLDAGYPDSGLGRCSRYYQSEPLAQSTPRFGLGGPDPYERIHRKKTLRVRTNPLRTNPLSRTRGSREATPKKARTTLAGLGEIMVTTVPMVQKSVLSLSPSFMRSPIACFFRLLLSVPCGTGQLPRRSL